LTLDAMAGTRTLEQTLRGLLPRTVRRSLSDALSERTSRRARRELVALADSGCDVVVGPWLGEVGFELLYWVPFLQWAVEAGGIDPARIVVISRGGTAAWYQHISTRYADVFDHLTPQEYDARNRIRLAEVGEQKQVRATAMEQEIVSRVSDTLGLHNPRVLPPSMMFEVMNAYWWGHRTDEWVMRHSQFRAFDVRAESTVPALPPGYAAVKFYFNECFPSTAENRKAAAAVVRELAEDGPVVSLVTGLRVDDHLAWADEEQMAVHGIRAALTPATNLGVQTAIVAGARAWAGTYGGFAYLAPFCRVPASAFYSHVAGFSRRHLDLAEQVFAGFGSGLLRLTDVSTVSGLARRPA
jgi:hypothetical protein